MANTRSAKKRVRASIRKRDRNRSTRSAAKTLVSRARRPGDAAGSGAVSLTSEDVRRAISALDKAAEKGIIHRNNASRRKGRLMAALARLGGEKAAPKTPASRAAAKKSASPAAGGAKKPAARPAKAKA